MRSTSILAAAVLGLATFATPVVSLACEGAGHEMALAPKKISAQELAGLQKKKTPVTVVDANGEKTRKEQGVIPGAVLLSNSSQYDLRELPANKDEKLVFYCANEKCSASETAATRALENGYSDVNVLPVGIKGWKAAGNQTAGIPRS